METKDKLSFRLHSPYDTKVVRTAKAVGVTPHQVGRLSTMMVLDHELLEMREELRSLRDEVIRFRKDFNDAVTE